MRPQLFAGIPFDPEKDLGRAYNFFMSTLPEDAYGVILDHDVMFTTIHWYNQITDAIQTVPGACFSGVTARIKCPFQVAEEADMKNHDMRYHREIGKKRLENLDLLEVTTNDRTPSGFLICLPKQAWREMGGFPSGFHLLDKRVWQGLKLIGRRIFIIKGLYLYHWHRGGGPDSDPYVDGPWCKQHTLPDGRVYGSTQEGTLE